jgi:hypothetical protein
MLALDLDLTAIVHRLPQLGRELTGVAEKTVRRRGRGVEDAELDGDGRDRLRRDSSSDSQRRLAPRWSNSAALLTSSTSPAWRASTNQSEREGERLSGR